MIIETKIIKILEDGDCGGGDSGGDTGSGDTGYGWVPGFYNYSSYTKKRKKRRKKRKKHNENVSATGGNDGALTGGDVYSIGVNMGTKPTPRSTGDLVLSPISTEPNMSDSEQGVPSKLMKKKKKATIIKSEKDGKNMRVLDYQGYVKTKMNVVTHLKK